MRAFIFLLSFLAASFAWAGPVPGSTVVPSETAGGHTFTDVSPNLIRLFCGFGAGTGNCTFRQANGSAGYTPSGTKSFHMVAYKLWSLTSTQVGVLFLASANDVGVSTATAPTSPVYFAGFASPLSCQTINVNNSCEQTADFIVPNGKFLTAANVATSAIAEVWGYEQ